MESGYDVTNRPRRTKPKGRHPDKALGPQGDIVQHRRALPHRDVAAAIATVRASEAAPVIRLAFEYLVSAFRRGT